MRQLVLFVLWEANDPVVFGRHPDVRIADIGEAMLAEDRLVERTWRKRYEEKLGYTSDSFSSSSALAVRSVSGWLALARAKQGPRPTWRMPESPPRRDLAPA